jgi:hypothetical protein
MYRCVVVRFSCPASSCIARAGAPRIARCEQNVCRSTCTPSGLKSLGRNRSQVIEAALPALAYTLSGEERKALERLWQVRRGAKIRSAKVV